MSAQADTNCHDIEKIVSATRTHLAKIGATYHVVPTCHDPDMSATFPPMAATGGGRGRRRRAAKAAAGGEEVG